VAERIGRGAEQSHCVLVASGPPEAFARLRILAGTNDGFRIAREDLKLRGMGDFFGAKQHGLPDFRFFDPERDEDLLTDARSLASALIEGDPELESPEHEPLRRILEGRFRDREALYEVG